jgi:hypothetical protein
MANGTRGHGHPASARPNHHQAHAALDRELLQLEKRKLVELRGGTVKLTRDGYLELYKRFPRRRS